MLSVSITQLEERHDRQCTLIDRECFAVPFDFRGLRDERSPDVVGRVALYGRQCVVGFALARLAGRRRDLVRLAVPREWRGHGIGRQLIGDAIRQAEDARSGQLAALLPEGEVAALTFLSRSGLNASALVRRKSGGDLVRIWRTLGGEPAGVGVRRG
jgi:GNAT superfamily N-acetyltransferase